MRKVQILGIGCPRCHRLLENTRQAAEESGIACDIVKVTDIVEMVSFGAMRLPALAIDGQVKVSGRVPAPDEIKSLLSVAAGGNVTCEVTCERSGYCT